MTTYLSFLAIGHSRRLASVNTAFQEVSKNLWITTYGGTLGTLGWFSNLDANYRFPLKPSFSLFPVLYPHWFSSISPFYFHFIYFFIYCVHACTHIPWHNKMSEESFLSPDHVCDFWGLNSDCQAWWQVPLLREPSCPFLRFVFSYSSGLSCMPSWNIPSLIFFPLAHHFWQALKLFCEHACLGSSLVLTPLAACPFDGTKPLVTGSFFTQQVLRKCFLLTKHGSDTWREECKHELSQSLSALWLVRRRWDLRVTGMLGRPVEVSYIWVTDMRRSNMRRAKQTKWPKPMKRSVDVSYWDMEEVLLRLKMEGLS